MAAEGMVVLAWSQDLSQLGRHHGFTRGMTIGSDPDLPFPVADPEMAPRHAQVVRVPGGWRVSPHSDVRSTEQALWRPDWTPDRPLEHLTELVVGASRFIFLCQDHYRAFHEVIGRLVTRDGSTGALRRRRLFELLRNHFAAHGPGAVERVYGLSIRLRSYEELADAHGTSFAEVTLRECVDRLRRSLDGTVNRPQVARLGRDRLAVVRFLGDESEPFAGFDADRSLASEALEEPSALLGFPRRSSSDVEIKPLDVSQLLAGAMVRLE